MGRWSGGWFWASGWARRRNARRIATWILLGSGAIVFACGRTPLPPTSTSPVIDKTAKVAQVAAAITGQPAPVADQVEEGKYIGFDTHTYPGTATMKTWKSTPGEPYSWVGYYLPSPCHADRSWVGKRDTLIAMGWGLAVVFVGQQTWNKNPRTLTNEQAAALRAHTPCSADLLSANEGAIDADAATAAAKTEGFPPNAIVFLDIERMETIPAAMTDYYRAWASRMLANGRYVPGFYAHQHNAEQIFSDVHAVFLAAGNTSTPRMWIAGGKGFDTGRAPQDVGFAFAGVWQGVIDVARSVADIKLPVDVNVARWMSPSESQTH